MQTIASSTLLVALGMILLGCTGSQGDLHGGEAKWDGKGDTPTPVRFPADDYVKPSDAELRERLTPLQYRVTQEDGTERPFTGEYEKNKAAGIYVDIVSGEPLFSSLDKFKSGTGWPSFWQPLSGAIGTKTDFKLLIPRREYHCHRCGGHQGHVFNDGPKPTGLRYCNNGVALVFQPD